MYRHESYSVDQNSNVKKAHLFHSTIMIIPRLLAITILIHNTVAHTYIYAVWINGHDMGRGDGKQGQSGKGPVPAYIRSVRSNDPVKNVMSKDMTCNTPGNPAPRHLDVNGGDKVFKLSLFSVSSSDFRRVR
jgi:hypothetical protein